MKENINNRIRKYACVPWFRAAADIGSGENGLRREQVQIQRQEYGSNLQPRRNRTTTGQCIRRAFINSFSLILFILAAVSLLTGLLLPDSYGMGTSSGIIIFVMLILSGLVRLYQELRAKAVADRLIRLVQSTVPVCRDGTWQEIPFEDLVVGDLVRLEAGDEVPADIRLCDTEDFFVSQSVITGESRIDEMDFAPMASAPDQISRYTNTIFQGASVTGGKALGIVLAVGADTFYGSMSAGPERSKRSFDRNTSSIVWVLLRFIAVLIPIVFIACGLTKGNWLESFLFALSVAVGLTPELLPMVINACLARGSSLMEQKQTVVKDINAMQTLGSMDVLCVDKTGTLTGDTVTLEYYMDILGNESSRVLDYAYLNSYYHSGVRNHLDASILQCRTMPGKEQYFQDLAAENTLMDELPFDYTRRYAGILIRGGDENLEIIKGTVKNVVNSCRYVEYRGEITEIGEDNSSGVHAVVDELTEEGMKVLAVAYRKTSESKLTQNHSDFILLGYLGFFDTPKDSAASAMKRLKDLQVGVRVLTGDETNTTVSVCRRLGIPADSVLTGSELTALPENEFTERVENTTVFTELSPQQKAAIVETLQKNGHCVGFLGDGMNDLAAQLRADVGISVDTACEAVQEGADVILMKKDLNVLGNGIVEGRRAFVNMSKYIKIVSSSNLGNIITVAIASILLPFFPMTSVQLLLLNLVYDIMCLILPWDKVDPEQICRPIKWMGRTLSRFMISFGVVYTFFDMITFLFLFFFLCPTVCGAPFDALDSAGRTLFISIFQTGWFLESIWTQVLVLYLLRTQKRPLIQSAPSLPVILVTLAGALLCTVFTLMPFSSAMGMTPLPVIFFLFLVLEVICYSALISAVKYLYCRRNHELL